MKNVVYLLIAGFAACWLVACDGGPAVVALPPPEVSVSQPIEREVGDHFETTGRTEAVESVDVRARVSGYLVEVNFEDGAEVEKGHVLFVIDPRPYEAEVQGVEAELARWEAQLREALADVARNQRLLPKGATSERELERSIASRDTAAAEIQGARARLAQAKLSLEFTRVTAPIKGRVSRTAVTVGNLIQAESASVLTTLVSVDPIYVYFDIDERTVLEQRERRRQAGDTSPPSDIKKRQIPVEISLANEDGYGQRGILDFIDNRVDPGTGTIKARGVFDNADRVLTPGLFLRVRLPLGQPRPSLLLPERAVGTDQGNKFVYVVNDSNVVEYRTVTLGPATDDHLRAVVGINPGDRVIVNGIQRARPGLTVAPQPVSIEPPKAGATGS